MSEEKCMLFAFRFYDLDGSGHTNLTRFKQFLTKFGINHYSHDQTAQIFDHYDVDKSGSIEHKELINRILEQKTTQITSPSRSIVSKKQTDDNKTQQAKQTL